MLPDFVTKVIDTIAVEHNFTDYQIETIAGSKHGDNFLGVIVAATVVGKRNIDGTEVDDQLPLVVKIPPANKSQREQFKSDAVFDRELHLYTKVLPALTAFQRDNGLSDSEIFTSYPKMYACDYNAEHDTHVLVMENLRARNFDMWPKAEEIPIDHELLVMEALGRLHGVSLAMKDQRPHEFEEFKQMDDILHTLMLEQFLKETSDRSTKALTNPEYAELVSVERFKEGMQNYLEWEARDKFGVITHGDCWSNNYLFQYGVDKSEVKAVSLIDWQLSRYCSPVADLLYHIFGNLSKEFRDQHFNTLLRTYHESLSEIVKRLGSDPQKLFTFDDLQSELQKYGDFALLCVPMITQVRLVKSENIAGLDSYAERFQNGEDVQFINDLDDETQAAFNKFVDGSVADLVEYGFVRLRHNN